MGYTACFEPAMLLSGARHTHLELCDTPLLDHGAYVVLGNEDWLLEALGTQRCDDAALAALVAWSIHASRALAVKVVNPGGISAFKFDQRVLDVDTPHSRYGVTPREVIRRLSATFNACTV
jgi:formylmethanofuran dehydrogenase subunit A